MVSLRSIRHIGRTVARTGILDVPFSFALHVDHAVARRDDDERAHPGRAIRRWERAA